ncbi:MAG: NUDIX domain-containing protein [Bacteroidetes bacterium]|nr:NUDIX domain-containing protein [Bacteroidota bacterium]
MPKLHQGRDYIGVGVGGIIVNDEHKILLLLRNKNPEKGCWSIPGGRVEFGEDVEDAIKREVKEELNISVEIVRLLRVTNHILEDKKVHWLSPAFELKYKSGELMNCEPDSHSTFKWFSLDSLPANITITTRLALESFRKTAA